MLAVDPHVRILIEALASEGPSTHVAKPERVRDAPDPSARVHNQHVKAHAVDAPFRMLAQNDVTGAHQPRLLPNRQRRRGFRQRRAGLDLDDRQDTGFLRDHIDFAGLCSQPPGMDEPAIRGQRGACGVLGRDAAAMGGLTSPAA